MVKETCPLKGREETFVEIPEEWLGLHALRRSQFQTDLEKEKKADDEKGILRYTIEMENAMMGLVLSDNFGNIPGCSPKDDWKKWDMTKVPLLMMRWISNTVIGSFNKTFEIPKA